MSFLLDCPNCGKRNVGEFSFQGELKERPRPDAPFEAWANYVYFYENRKGQQVEWWYHRAGCQRWFLVTRDTANNPDHRSSWFRDRSRPNPPPGEL